MKTNLKVHPVIAALLQIILTLSASFAVRAQDAPSPAVSDDERAKIEAVITDYIAENPEIVMGAIREWQRRSQMAKMGPKIAMYRGYLENEPSAPVLGNPKGDVTIVEFFDYRCGYCRRHFPELMQLVKSDGNIRLVPRQFPLLDRQGQPPVSRIAARAALAAHKQQKFDVFHHALMGEPGGLTEKRIYEVAASVGINVHQLKADMGSKLIDKTIENSLAIGFDIGFDGTPGYIIGNDVVLGAEGYGRLKEAVDRARGDHAKTAAN